jgi:hypothetical protein
MARDDIMILTSEIPFFQLMPNACKHMLFTSRTDMNNRMLMMRAAIAHLRSEGVLIYIGAGHREPDPAVYEGAADSIKRWLDIYDAFFKYVPDLKVMPALMSGMITEHWANHPFTKIRRKQRDRQRLAEFCQVIGQLMHPGRLMVTPKLSFAEPFTEAELRAGDANATLLQAVIIKTRQLLDYHCRKFYSRNAN